MDAISISEISDYPHNPYVLNPINHGSCSKTVLRVV